MTIEQAIVLAQTFGLVILYAITAMAPGLVLGIWLGNLMGAPGKETLVHKHQVNLKRASEHNAQWDPANQRWQK
ncbi:MAG TPA: hypothetical protein VJC05_04060 [Candidatus Andersenbacteria bacterium]|nr:hypothetical protein [Candidatus Andersenbacteria bacterium]